MTESLILNHQILHHTSLIQRINFHLKRRTDQGHFLEVRRGIPIAKLRSYRWQNENSHAWQVDATIPCR